jgi:hypothetical protein
MVTRLFTLYTRLYKSRLVVKATFARVAVQRLQYGWMMMMMMMWEVVVVVELTAQRCSRKGRGVLGM